ncbi:MAG: ammonium transporter [Microcystaceae cyanobacterium]
MPQYRDQAKIGRRYGLSHRSIAIGFSVLFIVLCCPRSVHSQPIASEMTSLATLQVAIDTLWVILAGCLVFFMNSGFAMLEAGFCRQQNTVNILSKNLIVFALSTLAFWAVGFALMFGDGNAFIGLNGFFLSGQDNSPQVADAYQGVYSALNWVGIPLQAKFFFQLVFAATAATIVSGAVAERIRFFAFFIFSLIMVSLIYPLAGHWIWGNGWLSNMGFYDFAGSTVVHSVGGWAALVGAVILGPRLGKYKNGKSYALPGHNLAFATLGCFILWLGWFGFNPGSTLSLNPPLVSHIILTTNLAAAMGGITATLTSWRYFGKPDLSLIINGILGGLVSITASCAYVSLGSAVIIGAIAGITIVFAVDFFDRLQIDDPVGAISVHLLGGLWGTLAVALFAVGNNVALNNSFVLYTEGPRKGLLLGGGLAGIQQLFIQLLGIASVSLLVVTLSWAGWLLIDLTMGLRVPPKAELKGLDISEHGLHAYTGFITRQEAIKWGGKSSKQ